MMILMELNSLGYSSTERFFRIIGADFQMLTAVFPITDRMDGNKRIEWDRMVLDEFPVRGN